jgi:hypothetical protein
MPATRVSGGNQRSKGMLSGDAGVADKTVFFWSLQKNIKNISCIEIKNIFNNNCKC